jgi:hypothetical protein
MDGVFGDDDGLYEPWMSFGYTGSNHYSGRATDTLIIIAFIMIWGFLWGGWILAVIVYSYGTHQNANYLRKQEAKRLAIVEKMEENGHKGIKQPFVETQLEHTAKLVGAWGHIGNTVVHLLFVVGIFAYPQEQMRHFPGSAGTEYVGATLCAAAYFAVGMALLLHREVKKVMLFYTIGAIILCAVGPFLAWRPMLKYGSLSWPMEWYFLWVGIAYCEYTTMFGQFLWLALVSMRDTSLEAQKSGPTQANMQALIGSGNANEAPQMK